MKKPEDMRRYSGSDEVDAVVIGTGAGGAPLLWRLARAGLRVVAIEAGRWWEDPSEEFATDEIAQRSLYWFDERLSGGHDPTGFGGNNSGIGVGGSTLHWGAYVPRPSASQMRLRTEKGAAVDWPVRLEELVPYYEEVERFIGVSGPSAYPWDPGRGYPLPPLPLNAAAQLMQRGCADLGIRTSPAPIAAVSRPYTMPEYGTRSACVNRGYCHQGCRNGAKASMDVTYLPAALQAGAEIREESFVFGIERGSDGCISAVLYMHEGQQMRQKCSHVFLCAGGVETPRQLLFWKVANSSGEVGRNFMAHVATQVWATFEEEKRPNLGFPASLITEDYIRPKDVNFSGGYLLQSYGILPITWAEQVARSRSLLGRDLIEYLRRYNHVAGIGMNGETLPCAENRITLSEEKDGRGMPKPHISLSLGEDERSMSTHGEGIMRSILKAAGGSDLWTSNRTAHTIGTCRMGDDSAASVVDRYGRSWDVPNLSIVDNSIFPTSLAANPALTIMALSLRSADAFLRHGRRARDRS